MAKLELREDFVEKKDLSRCLVCDVYVHPEESFVCPKCRKGPLCRKHRVPGRPECASCVFDMRRKELAALAGQEVSIQQFLRFLQFIFLLFAIFFVSLKFGLGEFIEILREPVLAKYLLYLGIVPILGYILFTVILYNQRNKIADAEMQIRKLDNRR